MKKLIVALTLTAILTIGVKAQSDTSINKVTPPDFDKKDNPTDKTKVDVNKLNQEINTPINPYKTKDKSTKKIKPDGFIIKNGKIMMRKHGKVTTLNQQMTLSDGTDVMNDGTIIRPDGTKEKLKEGDYMDLSGKITISKRSKKSK